MLLPFHLLLADSCWVPGLIRIVYSDNLGKGSRGTSHGFQNESLLKDNTCVIWLMPPWSASQKHTLIHGFPHRLCFRPCLKPSPFFPSWHNCSRLDPRWFEFKQDRWLLLPTCGACRTLIRHCSSATLICLLKQAGRQGGHIVDFEGGGATTQTSGQNNVELICLYLTPTHYPLFSNPLAHPVLSPTTPQPSPDIRDNSLLILSSATLRERDGYL